MIGDKYSVEPSHIELAKRVIERIKKSVQKEKLVIALSGESGCGKTTLAHAMKKVYERDHQATLLIQMDDYFHLPPRSNHEARLANLDHVGTQEVKLDLLNTHLKAFKSGKDNIEKPLVDYQANSITDETIPIEEFRVLLVEGTYVGQLSAPDYKIHFAHSYRDTHKNRQQRARDVMDRFNEKVLEIEHEIIQGQRALADLVISISYDLL